MGSAVRESGGGREGERERKESARLAARGLAQRNGENGENGGNGGNGEKLGKLTGIASRTNLPGTQSVYCNVPSQGPHTGFAYRRGASEERKKPNKPNQNCFTKSKNNYRIKYNRVSISIMVYWRISNSGSKPVACEGMKTGFASAFVRYKTPPLSEECYDFSNTFSSVGLFYSDPFLGQIKPRKRDIHHRKHIRDTHVLKN